MIDALRGDQTGKEPIADHPVWEALLANYGGTNTMAAAVDAEHREWVVYVPQKALGKTDNCDAPLNALLDDYCLHFRLPPRRARRWGIVPRDDRPDAEVEQPDQVFTVNTNRGRLLVANFGLARGLSREGADRLVEQLDRAGLPVRYARRPPRRVDDRRWTDSLQSMTLINWFLRFIVAAPFIAFAALFIGLPSESPVVAQATLVAAAVFAGLATAWINLSEWFREWWIAQISRDYLFDFSQNRTALAGDKHLGQEHFEILESINSPRIVASYARALNMALHLRDILGPSAGDPIGPVIDEIRLLATQIATTEMAVAAIHPAQLTTQIRRIEGQLDDAQSMDVIDSLMAQKSDLRRHLTRRDDDQLRLQSLSQRLHDLGAQLESLVRRHRLRDSPSASPTSPVVLELDALSAEIESVVAEQSQTTAVG